MPRIKYKEINFRTASLLRIQQANRFLEDYASQGFRVTLRQLYYRFVANDLIPNKMSEYNKLGAIINDARMAGYIDWDHIEDRTRELEYIPNQTDPTDLITKAAGWYHNDLWADQDYRVEVWIEKDALAGVIEPTCRKLDIAFLSCRGYTSQSTMWEGAQRLLEYIRDGKKVVLLHLGDHDPSGIDMSRDIEDRLAMFVGGHRHGDFENAGKKFTYDDFMEELEVRRIALNYAQVQEYGPPPNPAKLTDTRARGYIAEHGYQSWELDALEPTVLDGLIREHALSVMDVPKFNAAVEKQEHERSLLTEVAERWDEVEELMEA